MSFRRSAGILLHLTALPGRLGAGDLGPEAIRFVDFLSGAGVGLWQMLPIGPTGFGHSPYQSQSSFAGNPLLVSLEYLANAGLLARDDLEFAQDNPERADFERVLAWRAPLLERAFERFRERGEHRGTEYLEFCAANSRWLDDFVLFRAIAQAYPNGSWSDWPRELAVREPAALQDARARWSGQIEREKFLQFQFDRQWFALKNYARDRGVRLVGDIPIFAAHDSADVWARQELFDLDELGRLRTVAGVPPDYFSTSGQRWGNPLYRWSRHEDENYAWWTQRLARAIELFDIVRIDHFRGFEAYWEIPAGAPDARPGRWAPGPGAALFRAAERALGPLPVIAEDLGVITPPVEALRDELGYPGMKVLQFAFGDDPKGRDYRPHNYIRNCVVYTGTHDNNTTHGWFHSAPGGDTTRTQEQIAREQACTLAYVGGGGAEIHWDLIRLAWSSIADVAIAPLQDLLGLGGESRFNLPGTATGNWLWRVAPAALTPGVQARLRDLTFIYERQI